MKCNFSVLHYSFSLKKAMVTFMLAAFCFTGHLWAQVTETTTITIENARQTDYSKNEETDNDCIVLKGDVKLSVKKGETSSEITADTVTYDRKSQMLYAEGNVHIVTKTEGSGGQDATANSLIMNTSTLEGVFDGGKVVQTQSDALNLPSGSTLVVFSDVFGKSENNTIVFKNSSLTFCDDENPHWHIDASRTWLLPGGEFAFFNALLYVGPVPVFYFPAFYYPKDELIFNPNFGYGNKEGYYFQTTTYLYGRKPMAQEKGENASGATDSTQDIYNFMKSTSLKEQERQGLVLHNLDEPYLGDTSHYIKLMADWYSNLGAMIGVDGKIVPKKWTFISNFNFNASIAFGNRVNFQNGYYLPFDQNMTKEIYRTNFLGLELPFRYRGNLELNIRKPFSINISLPVYSDPDFASDFGNRNENMDWISMLTNFGKENQDVNNAVTSYTWKISASGNIPVSENLREYFSTVNLQAASSMNINTKSSYFYPSIVTPISASGTVSGTLFKYPSSKKSSAPEKPFMEFISPESEGESEVAEVTENKLTEENTETENILVPTYPELNPTVTYYNLPSGVIYNLSYSFTPSYVNQMNFDLSSITKPEDFEWTKIKSSMYTIKAPLSVTSNLSYGQSFLNLKNTVSYNPVWQSHPVTEGLTETEKNNVLLADYKAESQTISSVNVLSVRPFIYLPAFKESSFTYNTTINLFRKTFTGTVENPEWQYFGPDWTDEDSVTVHNLNMSFITSQQNNTFRQSLTFTANIYPQVPKFTGTFNFVFPYTNLSLSAGVNQKSKADTSWIFNPINESLNFNLLDSQLKLSQSFSFNVEEKHADSLRFAVSYKNLSSSFTMQYTNLYDFDTLNGWQMKNEKAFQPAALNFAYTLPQKYYNLWFNRISIAPGLSTNLTADLIRPTNSYLTFTPSLSFKIYDFLTITFSSTSRNSVLYRYVQSMAGTPGRIPGEENPFIDLFDSFRFDDKQKRENSGWKLKSLNLTVAHELHDWNLNMTLKIEPRLITINNKKSYSYNPYFSLGVTWKPMESIKTQVTDEYGKWKFE